MSRPRRLAHGLIASGIVAQAAFAAGHARAAEPARALREAITVEPGATCLDDATLVEHVLSWVGADTVDPDVVVDVRGSPDQPRVAGFRVLRGGRVIAVRRFDPGPSRCEQLHAVLGLAIAMALKASLIDEVAPNRVAASPVSPSGAMFPPATAKAPSAAVLDVAHPWTVGAEALAALAVSPDPAFGVDARIERALTPTFRARLGLLALLSPAETFDGAPGHFTTWLLAPRLDLCAGFEMTRRLRAHGCMGMSGGGLHAEGFSYPSPRSTFIRWVAVANELGVRAKLSRNWSIGAAATLILPVARNSIVLRDYSGSVLQQRDLGSVGSIFAIGPLFCF